MLGRTYDQEACSAARALEVAGERWSLLILRNAMFAGMTRFTDFQRSLAIAPNILAKRLESFVSEGLMTSSKGKSEHLEYHLTNKGHDFAPVIVALTKWGDRWDAPDGPPIVYEHEGCGGRVESRLFCKECGGVVKAKHVLARKTKAMALYKERAQARGNDVAEPLLAVQGLRLALRQVSRKKILATWLSSHKKHGSRRSHLKCFFTIIARIPWPILHSATGAQLTEYKAIRTL